MSDLYDYFKAREDVMIDLLTEIVSYETPSRDKAAVDKLGDFIENYINQMGQPTLTHLPQSEVGDILLAKWNTDKSGKPILVMMHLDTVWPLGTLSTRPVTRDDEGRLFGPGIVDMKAGVTIFLSAMRALIERSELPEYPIWALFTTDEEIGSRHSAPVIREIAAECGLVLVMEPGTNDGAVKTQRKGIATYRLHVEGRAAHAGNEPEQGINAIVELAQQVMRLNGLNNLRNGTSVSVTMTEGGTTGNVIPEKASIYVDTRTITAMEMERIQGEIIQSQPFMPGAKVTVEAIHSRPPMERNATMEKTFAQCKAIGDALGVTVREDSVGGGSDGNHTAHLGIPTLDGLGPYGGGLHALHEHVLISSIAQRATLLTGLLRDWRFE